MRSVTDGRVAGEVLSISPSGSVTLRSPGPEFVPEGGIVRDRRGRFRGRVVRVFGPVGRPFLSIRPRRTMPAEVGAALLGQTLVEERGEVHGE